MKMRVRNVARIHVRQKVGDFVTHQVSSIAVFSSTTNVVFLSCCLRVLFINGNIYTICFIVIIVFAVATAFAVSCMSFNKHPGTDARTHGRTGNVKDMQIGEVALLKNRLSGSFTIFPSVLGHVPTSSPQKISENRPKSCTGLPTQLI